MVFFISHLFLYVVCVLVIFEMQSKASRRCFSFHFSLMRRLQVFHWMHYCSGVVHYALFFYTVFVLYTACVFFIGFCFLFLFCCLSFVQFRYLTCWYNTKKPKNLFDINGMKWLHTNLGMWCVQCKDFSRENGGKSRLNPNIE